MRRIATEGSYIPPVVHGALYGAIGTAVANLVQPHLPFEQNGFFGVVIHGAIVLSSGVALADAMRKDKRVVLELDKPGVRRQNKQVLIGISGAAILSAALYYRRNG